MPKDHRKNTGTQLTVGDETLSIPQWAARAGIKTGTLYYRLEHGWSVEDAVGISPHFHNRKYDGDVTQDHVHGASGTKEYRSWSHLVERCTNPKNKSYARYGGRGIKVADEWRDVGGFSVFLAHVGLAPTSEHEIDRIDNNGNYVPGNVRWATAMEQARNRSSNLRITAFGETKCLAEWAISSGIRAMTIHRRFTVMGWSAEESVSVPVGKSQRPVVKPIYYCSCGKTVCGNNIHVKHRAMHERRADGHRYVPLDEYERRFPLGEPERFKQRTSK